MNVSAREPDPSQTTLDHRRWREREVVKHHLLTSSLFVERPGNVQHDLPENALWDCRGTPFQDLRCQDRVKLLWNLSQHIGHYEALGAILSHPHYREAVQKTLQNSLITVTRACRRFLELRENDLLSHQGKQRARSLKSKSVLRALDIIRDVCDVLELQQYSYTPGEITERKTGEVYKMTLTLARHGPFQCSEVVKYHSIGVLLSHFQLEDGTPEQIAMRMQQRLARLSPSHKEALRSLFEQSPVLL